MSQINVRDLVYDKLIAEFRLLKHDDIDATPVWQSVEKFFTTYPTSSPVCELMMGPGSIVPMGMEFNSHNLSFQAMSQWTLEKKSTTEVGKIMTQVARVEDRLFRWLQELPNNIEREISGVEIYQIDDISSDYAYIEGEAGFLIRQFVLFTVKANEDPKALPA